MINLKQATEHLNNAIEKAAQIAIIAHSGQTDLDDKPVILHPFAVAMQGNNDDEQICGFLHDVVEDTNYTFADLSEAGIPQNCIETLKLLTHDKNMSYEDYLIRIKNSGNETAIAVKIHDLTHNLKRGRAGNHLKQVAKHEKALKFMTK